MNLAGEKKGGLAPALTLMILAPLLAEVLPGATRFSALFVLPIEICVWGGGALLIRDLVQRHRLGWAGMLLLALSLAIAEECLIQQTSLAPMVIQLKGQTYGRIFGVNYVYFLWALAYESIFVVFLPIALVEMLFPDRRDRPWMNRVGFITVIAVFFIGCFFAWFSWTRIARPKVFHLPIYDPPLSTQLLAAAVICILIFAALRSLKFHPAFMTAARKTPSSWIIGAGSALWAILWYGLVLLAFGIDPSFPPFLAFSLGLLLMIGIVLVLLRFTASERWRTVHLYALVFGAMAGSMTAGFIGFIGAAPADLYFKLIMDILAVLFMIRLGIILKKGPLLPAN